MNIKILIYNTMAANGPILTDYYINSLIQRGDIFSGTFFIPNFGKRDERKSFDRRIVVWWNSQVICITQHSVREMVSVGYL